PFLLVRRGRHYLPVLAARWGGGPAAGAGTGAVADGAAQGAVMDGAPGATAQAAAGAAAEANGPLWLHAGSVGGVGVAAPLARALPAEVPLLVTTVTPTGQEMARRLFAGRATVAYLPFDLGPAVNRFWRRFAPAALVLVEGDYWPLVLQEARRHGV